MDYLDFELVIEAGTGSTYPVTVIHSPAGEAHTSMTFPFDEQALANQLLTVQQALTSSNGATPEMLAGKVQTVERFGQTLFQTLFTGEVGNLYAVSQSRASSQGKGLRLKLHVQAAELAVLPWELLYDTGQGKYLCLSDYTPVVRYLELPAPPQPLSIAPPLCILGMVASPKDLPALDVEREKQRIETALAELSAKGLVQLTWIEGRTCQDVQQALSVGCWHIFHFIGHGGFRSDTNEGIIVMEDGAGQADYLSATQVGMLLTDHRSLRLVVLNSCEGARGSSRESFSSTAATLVRQGIPAVLANQYAISDAAAMAFSSTFYTALAEGRPVDMAVSEARKAIALEGTNTMEWAVPTLHMHTPDGVLFHLPQTVFPSSRAPGVPAASSAPLFVSYARKDQEVVNRLCEDLQRFGVTLWIDHKDILPGSRDWGNIIRTALRSSSGVLWVVTPSTLNSPYVQDELDIARLYQRPIYPLWIEGSEWINTVPLGWGRIQYIDAREERYEAALAQLVQFVRKQPSDSPAATQSTKQRSATAPQQISDLLSLSQPTKQRSGSALQQPSDSPSLSQLTKQESAAAPRNPYKGLQYFTTADAGDFFGREQLIADLVNEIKKALGKEQVGGEEARLVAVIGSSGSGKSSVVMAGLLPRLHQNALPASSEWIYLERMVPGAHPLEALARTLAYQFPARSHTSLLEDLTASSARGLHLLAEQLAQPKQTQVVLLIDQFEEIFTQTTDTAEREQFLRVLTTAASEPGGSLLIILTLRADFYDRPLQYPTLYRLLQTHQVAVLPMESVDLRKVIERPASLPDVQLSFEENLVGDLLFELRGQAGALPLLEFTLDQLFQRRNGRHITRQAYQEIGGVKGALAKHAEATYAELPSEEHRKLARALFLRLLEPGASEQETTRRRAVLSEFTFEDQGQTRLMQETTEIFVKARLLTTTTNESAGTNTIEVSHEALIREWPRLIGWLHEAREDIRLQQTISEDAAAWERHHKPGDRLYRGSQLKEAQAWARRNVPSGSEVAFLRASATQRIRSVVSLTVIVLLLLSTTGLASWFLTRPSTRVTTLNDSGPGSLRQVLDLAQARSTITFDDNLRGTILLSENLNISKSFTFSGPGASMLAISSGSHGYSIQVDVSANVTITGLAFKDSTVKNVYPNPYTSFINNFGKLTLKNCIVSGNTSAYGGSGSGGGINNSGTLTLINSTVTHNTAAGFIHTSNGNGGGNGGGINNSGTLTLINSTVTHNTAAGGSSSQPNSGYYGTGGNGGGITNGGTLTLTNSTVSYNIAAAGIGATNGNVNGGGNGGGITNGGTLTLTNSTVSHNTASGGDYSKSTSTTLSYPGSSGGSGGGIANSGPLTLTNSTISDNTAAGGIDATNGNGGNGGYGGGISNNSGYDPSSGMIKIINTTISGNTASGTSSKSGGCGGGISNQSSTLTLIDSTISSNTTSGGSISDNPPPSSPNNFTFPLNCGGSGNNSVGSGGGGIANFGSFTYNGPGYSYINGALTLTNSTIAGNTSASRGGGIIDWGSKTDVTFCTIYGNAAAKGDSIAAETSNGYEYHNNGPPTSKSFLSHVQIRNSIVAGDSAHTGSDFDGTITSGGYNLIDANFASSKQQSTDRVVKDLSRVFGAQAALGNHGGSTKTYALLPGTDDPAVDQIPLAECQINGITTDQRGVKRPDDGDDMCDIGAYE